MRKATLFLFLLLLLPTILVADIVYLKGAGTVEGQIVEQTATMVTVNLGYGTVGVPVERIDHIVKAPSPLDDYDARAGKLGPQDLNGWLALARWAEQKGLNTQAGEAYQKVLAIAPNNTEANEALGFVLLDGRWVTEAESYRSRGYVKYDGEWMMPAEAQMLQQNALAEKAQRDADRRARDAESAALAAQAQAQEAEAKAQKKAEEEADDYQNDPVYWGGWGYGVTTWPAVGNVRQPVNRPVARPVGGRR